MASLAQLKKRKGNLKKLQEKLENSNNSGAPRDERIWKPKFNPEKGRGTAIVRFLPPIEGESFVEVKTHSFTGPGGNYFDIARETIGEDDPIQIAAINGFRKAKHTDDKRYKEEAKKFLPRSQYYANVVVLRDEENPENVGKVMIFQFGRQIYGKLEKAIKPEYDDVDPFDPFDLWEGADFRIRMSAKEIPDQKTGKMITVPTYEDSSFDRTSEFMEGDEEKLEELFNKTYDLSEFVDPSKVKSFEDVAERFKRVMGKPYNWLDPDAVAEAAQEADQQRAMDQQQSEPDPAPSTDSDEGEPPFDGGRRVDNSSGDDDDNDDEGGEEESPLARFKRLSGQS